MIRLIVCGAGKWGSYLTAYKLKEGCEIICFCDNDESKEGKEINGFMINKTETVVSLMYDVIIIAAAGASASILDQLLSLGVSREKIIFSYDPKMLQYCNSPLDMFFDIPKLPYKIRFEKKPAEARGEFKGETFKSFERRKREGFFEKYCHGEGLDIGYGGDAILPDCAGWDIENGDAQSIAEVEDESFDFVYSSHCLEHIWDVREAIKNWFRAVKKGGYLIIAIPDRDLYEKKKSLPSRWNGDHKHMFLIGKAEFPDTLDIVEEVRNSIENYQIEYVKRCDEGHTIIDPLKHSNGEYQIEMVIKKLS